MWLTINTIGCLMLAAHAAAGTGPPLRSQETVQDKQTSRDPYVDTPAYLAFPWTFEAEHAFIYVVNPVSSTPTPAAACAGYTGQLSMLSGFQNGLLVVFKYTKSPVGPYSEILYSPGRHTTGCGTDSMQHVARIWVDSPFSQRAGRNIWGMPKELATFDWSTGPNWVKVSVKDNNSGKLIFEAKMADVPIPRPLMSKGMQLVSAIMPGACVSAVQLPIDDNTGKTEYADVAAYGVAQKAFSSKPMGRVTTAVCFDVAGTISKVLHSFVDAEAWTGRSQESVSLLPLALHMPAGATASLTAPVLCQPAAADGSSVTAVSPRITAENASSKKKKKQRTAPTVGVGSMVFPFLG